MKKLLLTTICLLMSSSVFASAFINGYTDSFHLSTKSVQNLTITGAITSQGNVTASKTDTASFRISDKCDPNGCVFGDTGTAYVTYSEDANNYCKLTVTDGSMMDDPTINSNCHGKLDYIAYQYDGTLSYSYSLIFLND